MKVKSVVKLAVKLVAALFLFTNLAHASSAKVLNGVEKSLNNYPGSVQTCVSSDGRTSVPITIAPGITWKVTEARLDNLVLKPSKSKSFDVFEYDSRIKDEDHDNWETAQLTLVLNDDGTQTGVLIHQNQVDRVGLTNTVETLNCR